MLYGTIITAEDLGDEIKGKVIMPVTTSMQRSTPRASLRTALAALGADNTAYLPFGWHIKGWYKDPAYIVIDSLQLNMDGAAAATPRRPLITSLTDGQLGRASTAPTLRVRDGMITVRRQRR